MAVKDQRAGVGEKKRKAAGGKVALTRIFTDFHALCRGGAVGIETFVQDQMLTGELPARKIEPPSKKVAIAARLDEVVLRAMENNPELRYQQASVLKTQLETIVSAGSSKGENPRSHNLKGNVFGLFNSDEVERGKAAAENWLALIDRGEFARSWEMATKRFRAAITKEKWIDRLHCSREPLGNVFSRKLRSSLVFGLWLRLSYDTVYAENKATVEVLIVRLERDGQWRATSYRQSRRRP
jgi:hypothetical protein